MIHTKNNAVTVKTTLAASVAEVWAAWTKPQLMGWYGSDPAGTVIEAHADARRGRGFRVTFQQSDGTRYTCLGTYLKVEPLSLLEFTWTWAGREDRTERVLVAFAPHSEGTALTLEHRDIDPHTSHNYVEGWRTTFEKLAKQLRG